MNSIWFINGLSCILVSILSVILSYLYYKKRADILIYPLFGIQATLFFLYGLIQILWSFNFIMPLTSDFIILTALFHIIHAIIFVIIVYFFVNDKNLLFLLSIFIVTVIFAPILISFSIQNLSIISFILISLSSFYLFIILKRYTKRIIFLLLSYGLLSTLIHIFSLNNLNFTPWFISNIVFIFILIFFIFDIDINNKSNTTIFLRTKIETKKIRKLQNKNSLFNTLLFLIKFILFIILINIIVIVSTVTIHELGHSFAAVLYGCERTISVIYETNDMPHTEIICGESYNNIIITILGVISPIILGTLFVITGNKFIKYVSYIIIGFSLIISPLDFKNIGFSPTLVFILTFLGFIISLTGVILLSYHYIKEDPLLSNETLEDDSKVIVINEYKISSLYSLLEFLSRINSLQFKFILRDNWDNICDWVESYTQDSEFALLLRKTKDKNEVIELLLNYLIEKKR